MNRFDEAMARGRANRGPWQCPEHGVYGDRTVYGRTPTDCSGCSDRLREIEREHAESMRTFRAWDENAGVPTRYRCATIGHIQPVNASAKRLRSSVANYMANIGDRLADGDGLTLLGPVGTGKTLALCALVNTLCKDGVAAQYVGFPELVADLKASFGERHADDRSPMEGPMSCDLLALDEIGVKALTEFEAATLFALVDGRYTQRAATLIASNAREKELPALLGERVADRLRETNSVVILAGPSQRGVIPPSGPDAILRPKAVEICVHDFGRWQTHVVGAPK
ncbi:MAG: ATP-binding protein [Xanthomonadales bacterium]|nr:ATP-binding protein [Xanthomonadales bacterium]